MGIILSIVIGCLAAEEVATLQAPSSDVTDLSLVTFLSPPKAFE